MKNIISTIAIIGLFGTANAADITWADKVTGGTFSAADANEVKVAVNSRPGPWLTSTAYVVNQYVIQGDGIYICMANHTSGTFATDLAAVRWKFWGSDIYASKAEALVGDCTVGPCLDGSSDGGNIIKLWAGTGDKWTALQGGAPAANRLWKLPIAAAPGTGLTYWMTMDEYGQMGFTTPKVNLSQFTDDIGVGDVQSSEVITVANTTPYTPTADYHPATKKYVDDSITAGGGYTDEQAQDAAGAMVTGNTETGVAVTYDDATAKLNFVVDFSAYQTTAGLAAAVAANSAVAANTAKVSFDSTSSARLAGTSGTNTGDNATNSQYSGLATSKQDADADLTAIAALTCTENQIPKRNSSSVWVCGADNEGAGGGISHAASDGNYYASRNGAWASLTGLYLAAGGTAANSSQLEGHAASYFQTSLTNPVVQANLGTGVYTLLGTPTISNFFSAVTGEGAFAATLMGYADAAAVLSGIGAQAVLTNPLVRADIDDTPVNGEITGPVSSNWAYDHVAAADPHSGYVLESALGTSVGTFLATPTAANFFSAVTGEGAFAATLFGYADAAAVFTGIKQAATETATGVIERATTAEVVTGTATDLAVTPAGVTARIAAPGTIGGTTPGIVNATTIAAGAGGFAVDADGDMTVKSLNQTKTSGTAGDLGLFEANSTDTHAAGLRGPASITGDGAYRGQFANAGPTVASVQVWGAQGSGTGTAADPYIHQTPFVDFDQLFTVSGTSLLLKSGTSLPGTCSVGALFLDTDADTNGQLYSCVATNTWKDVDDDGGAAGTPTAITVADTTDTTSYVGLFESATGDLGPKTDGGLTYNAGTGMLTATGFTGPLTGTASGNLVSGGALGTPSGGTLTNASGLPLSGVVDSTSEALGVGTLEVGAATDTTLARSGAGAVTVEGVQVVLAGGSLGAGTATTPSAQDNDTSVATTAFVNTEIAADAVLKATAKSLDFDWKSPVDVDDRMIRLPTAITVTGLYCIATGSTPSIAVALNECDNAGVNCAASGATVTANGGVDSDTTITDGAYDAADYLQITVGAPTGTVDYLTCSVTYTN